MFCLIILNEKKPKPKRFFGLFNHPSLEILVNHLWSQKEVLQKQTLCRMEEGQFLIFLAVNTALKDCIVLKIEVVDLPL